MRPALLGRLNRASSYRALTSRALPKGPSLGDFIQSSSTPASSSKLRGDDTSLMNEPTEVDPMSSLQAQQEDRTFHIETYGCQMNVADSDVVRAVMMGAGYRWVDAAEGADVVFLNTCAIRDNAEKRIWGRVGVMKGMKRRGESGKIVGLLGCMAERLKTKLLEEEAVDLVAGPDAYRDLPNLIQLVRGGDKASNVQLSQDETYADIKPVRVTREGAFASAFVSVMRGCNNMCSYCIVPFTRGRERSRPVKSVLDEVKRLSHEGVKEIVLLGQNVNSYHDSKSTEALQEASSSSSTYQTAHGFKNMYKKRDGLGLRFADLLARVSDIDPEMRIRFTSPHPKDFPDDLLTLISERHNLCKSLHLPAQSGSTAVLDRMRRGYSREAYLALVEHVRAIIPGVTLSSDFITGFCGETDEEHKDTVTLMEQVGYEQAFMFAYSKRDKTHAAYRLQDDVPHEVKQRRLYEIIDVFRQGVHDKNQEEIGRVHVVLVEGYSKRSKKEEPTLTGRTDTNKRCIVPDIKVPSEGLPDILRRLSLPTHPLTSTTTPLVQILPGDYVAVQVTKAHGQTLIATPLARTSLVEFSRSTPSFALDTISRPVGVRPTDEVVGATSLAMGN